MIQRKICLLGAFSVGKTSLIKRFVSSMFDDRYLTTVGVKIDKKVVRTGDTDVSLMVWDLAGEDDYARLRTSYLRGASGYVLVVDGTRPKSLEVAARLHETARELLGDLPFVLALNKADLAEQWQLDDDRLAQHFDGMTPVRTSAKTGERVEEMFLSLTERML